jgi:uncharacterized protein YdhG (YjbR/CyaY superfamily)
VTVIPEFIISIILPIFIIATLFLVTIFRRAKGNKMQTIKRNWRNQHPLDGNMNEKADEYLKRQKSPQREICLKLREMIFETIPDAKEEMKWGVPTYADGKFYIVALKDHVNLGISLKGLSEKIQKLLEGSGKTMKHITIRSIGEIEEKRVAELLTLVLKR